METRFDWPVRYGAGIIREHCDDVDDYVVLTSPTAWQVVKPQLRHEPKAVHFVESQEETYTDKMIEKLPPCAWAVGAGGGMALDAAKIVAHVKEVDLLMVPTIVSTAAPFQPFYPMRRDGKVLRVVSTPEPKGVLFDTDVIRAAPPHLNASGMGECICWLGIVAAWQWWCAQDLPGDPWDEAAADETVRWVQASAAGYAADLDRQGRPGPEAIRIGAEVNRQRYDLHMFNMKVNHALDHPFVNAFMWTHGWEPLHGEAVALGTLITCQLCDLRLEETRKLFEACGTRYRPSQIGCNWDQVRAALQRADAAVKEETILSRMEIDDATFRSLVDAIGD